MPYKTLTLEDAYSYDPLEVFRQNPTVASHHILGIESPVWTEGIPHKERLDFSVFPRLIAHAEVGWTNVDNKNYEDFLTRLEDFAVLLNHFDITSTNYKIMPTAVTPHEKESAKEDFYHGDKQKEYNDYLNKMKQDGF